LLNIFIATYALITGLSAKAESRTSGWVAIFGSKEQAFDEWIEKGGGVQDREPLVDAASRN